MRVDKVFILWKAFWQYFVCLIFQADKRPVVSSELVQVLQIIW